MPVGYQKQGYERGQHKLSESSFQLLREAIWLTRYQEAQRSTHWYRSMLVELPYRCWHFVPECLLVKWNRDHVFDRL